MRRLNTGGRKTGTVRTSVLAAMLVPILAIVLGVGSFLAPANAATGSSEAVGAPAISSAVLGSKDSASPQPIRKAVRTRSEALVTGAAMEIAISVPRS